MELYQCILCPYKSGRKSNLQKHFMIHTKEKPFKCYNCDFSAATKSTLVLHVRTHTGEKPYECAICQRKFSRRNIIKAHVKTHTNDKPFECPECDFATSRKDNLKFHMRRHLIEKPFKCYICGCSFIQKCRFKRHLELHSKMFKCVLCFYQTHLEVNLLKHKLSHFKADTFICYLCGKEFGKKYGMRVHIMKLHSGAEWRTKNGNHSVKHIGEVKTYSDKAIATDDFNVPQIDISPNKPISLLDVQDLSEISGNVVQDSTETYENVQNCNDSEYDTSSSDSEDSNPNTPIVIESNAPQNFTFLGPELFLNYQPNYVLNVMQPIVIPLQSGINIDPVIFTPVVNQDNVSFMPVCNSPNVYLNNLVPTVSDSVANLMLNPTKTVFVNEMY